MSFEALVDPVIVIAQRASEQILKTYLTDFDIEAKEDQSPLTEADLASHRTIVEGLRELTPDLPILSEESADIPYAERRTWTTYWLVDPLDGTKEFIKKNGEFTVNIALIKNGLPMAGVVHVPATGVTYSGCVGVGACRREAGAQPEPIRVGSSAANPVRVVASRSHRSTAIDSYLEKLGNHEIVSMGSSLKICLVAENRADVYPRLGLTSEWDTAAAHAVVAAAGGRIISAESGEDLVYNSKESILNPHFIVFGDRSRNWLEYV
ncbi:MAG: 3'(2'),5'-bisphosphate nucleotidase CysQ [Gammaproteobacteria bacterium]